jgi:hypothetical protein
VSWTERKCKDLKKQVSRDTNSVDLKVITDKIEQLKEDLGPAQAQLAVEANVVISEFRENNRWWMKRLRGKRDDLILE